MEGIGKLIIQLNCAHFLGKNTILAMKNKNGSFVKAF
jgi:hypothetical protein